MIRSLDRGDLPQLSAHGEKFWQLSPYAELDYDANEVEELCSELASNHYLRVAEEKGKVVGFIAILITPLHFNSEYSLGTEVFFYVEPQYRGTLGKELMELAELEVSPMVDILSFGDMTTSTNMKQYYESRGYKHAESSYAKVL